MKAERMKYSWDLCALNLSLKRPQKAHNLDSIGNDKNQVNLKFTLSSFNWPLWNPVLRDSQPCQISTVYTRRTYILFCSFCFSFGSFPWKQVVVAGLEPMGALCHHTLWRTLRWTRPMTVIPGKPFCGMPKQPKTTHIGFLQHIPSKFNIERVLCLVNREEYSNDCFEVLTFPFLVLFLSMKNRSGTYSPQIWHLFVS